MFIPRGDCNCVIDHLLHVLGKRSNKLQHCCGFSIYDINLTYMYIIMLANYYFIGNDPEKIEDSG